MQYKMLQACRICKALKHRIAGFIVQAGIIIQCGPIAVLRLKANGQVNFRGMGNKSRSLRGSKHYHTCFNTYPFNW